MKKRSQTLRFEVDYKQRLEQQRTANNAVRLPRLGYKLYRIYDIEEKKDKTALNAQYGQHIGRGIRPGPMNISYGSVGTGKSSYNATRQYNSGNWQQVLWAFIDKLESRSEPAYDVRWLKPKQATLLRMRGHRVEPAAEGERPGRVNPLPVRLGR